MRNRVLIPRSLAEWTTRSDPATGLAAGKVLEGRAPGEWGLSTQDLNQVPLLVGFAIVGAAVVFGVVVARGLRTAPQQTARRLLIVAGTGVMSIVVLWTGLPVILAAGAVTLALDARRRLGRLPGTATTASRFVLKSVQTTRSGVKRSTQR